MCRIAITTECVSDLPLKTLMERNISQIFFEVYTEEGVFRDTDEITAVNVIEYIQGGEKKAKSHSPKANEYKKFFEDQLAEYDEVIHICISSGISKSVEEASLALAKMGLDASRVHIVDSKHLSMGLGILVLLAARLRDEGKSVDEIINEVNNTIPKISTTFITKDVDYLYYAGKVSEKVSKFCKAFSIHPVLYMKDGVLTVKKAYVGNYTKAYLRYIKSTLKNEKDIDKSVGAIIKAGCSREMSVRILKDVETRISFEQQIVNEASATVTCNCGPETFGVLFAYK